MEGWPVRQSQPDRRPSRWLAERSAQAQGLHRLESGLHSLLRGPRDASAPLLPTKVLTLCKRREMLLVRTRAAMSQCILKTVYLAGGLDRRGGRAISQVQG